MNGQLTDQVLLPRELTAENGAKALLIGEFFERVEVYNPDACGCGRPACESCAEEPEFVNRRIAVSWDTIKRIYATIVQHYTEGR